MLFVYHDNCSVQFMLTLTNAEDNSSSLWQIVSHHPQMEHSFFIILLCILRLGAFIVNSLALTVFVLNKSLPIRRMLTALSSAEVILCFSSFLRNFLELVTTQGEGVAGSRPLLQFYDAVSIANFAALLTRNWFIVLISASKCDALLRPLQWRQGLLWHQRNELIIFALIAVLSLSVSIFYDCLTIPHYCSHDGKLIILYFPLGRQVLFRTSDIFFIFQSTIPVFAILILCTIIIVTLRLRRWHLTVDSIASDSRTQLALSRHTDQATVLSLALALTFIPLEMPAFVANHLAIPLLGHLSNVCVAMDSLANFFLYCCLNRHFRDRCRRVCYTSSADQGRNSAQIRFDISSNPPHTLRLTSQLSSPAPGTQHRLSGHSTTNPFFTAAKRQNRLSAPEIISLPSHVLEPLRKSLSYDVNHYENH